MKLLSENIWNHDSVLFTIHEYFLYLSLINNIFFVSQGKRTPNLYLNTSPSSSFVQSVSNFVQLKSSSSLFSSTLLRSEVLYQLPLVLV